MTTPTPERTVDEIVEEFNKLHTVSVTLQSGMMAGNNTEEDCIKGYERLEQWLTQTLTAERQRREEAVEAERERCRWEGVMVAMNTLAIHTDQIWQSTIQKDSIYKYIDDVQDEAEQKLQALTQPNNQK